MERGSRMHESCEMYLNGWAENLIEEVAAWKEALDGLKEKTFQAEKAWGFDEIVEPAAGLVPQGHMASGQV